MQGRNTSHVVAAAMYIVCRKEKTPHLLIDFSDELQVRLAQQINLYTLGSCYLKLVKFLHFEMQPIDPSLFIHRFSAKLEFGEMQSKVTDTALRLLQRMKRDWMCHGRRPTGLVGAAILIAAKYHGFKRTTNQIVKTVHVCDETIRKRLVEFKQTSVAKLTREEFEKIDLEKDIIEECDPPSFKKSEKIQEILKITNYERELEKNASIIEIQISEPETANELTVQTVSPNSAVVAVVPATATPPAVDPEADFDDAEIEGYLLSKEEAAVKSIIWHKMHKEWLEEQTVKENKKKNKTESATKRRKKNRERTPDSRSGRRARRRLGRAQTLEDRRQDKPRSTEQPLLRRRAK